MSITIGFFLAFLLTTFLIPLASKLGFWIGILDNPNARKIHEKPMPRTGGLGIFVGVLVSLLAIYPADNLELGFVAGALVLLFFGVWDDYKGLDYKVKFAGQILASLIFLEISGLRISTLGEIVPNFVFDLGLFSIPISVIFLLATINIINLSDGLDALASGLSLLIFICIFGLSLIQESTSVVFLSAILSAAIIGFLLYNIHPATIFLGDAGSQFLGFCIGVLLIKTTQGNTIYSPVLPLFVIGVPIIDTASVMVYRILKGKSPFTPDKNHLHHKLLDFGLTHQQAVIILYMMHFLLIVIGWWMKFNQDYVILYSYFVVSTALYLIFFVLMRYQDDRMSFVTSFADLIYKSYKLMMSTSVRYYITKYSWILMLCFLGLLFVVPTYFVPVSEFNLAYISILVFLTTYLIIIKSSGLDFFLRIVTYMLLCYYTYVMITGEQTLTLLSHELEISNVLFFGLGIFFIPCLVLTPEKKPFDALHILSIAIVIFLFILPAAYLPIVNMPYSFAKLLLVGWVVNLVFSRIQRNRKVVLSFVILSLAFSFGKQVLGFIS